MSETYIPVIGLEVHIELSTKSKMFCPCSGDHFGKEPNTQTCPVCLGLPGALPVPNKKAVEWCMTLGLALHCSIPRESKFDRKNYFYPDLPKGYQISQYDKPFCINGWLEVSSSFLPRIGVRGKLQQESTEKKEWIPDQVRNDSMRKRIRIRRVHMEEDTGKLQHVTVDGERMTLVDFNRSGVPLVEIVTEPDFHSIEEVDVFVRKLQRIIRYLEISNADMEKGSMRIEPSISVRKIKNQKSKIKNTDKILKSKKLPDYRVELKNINSFRFVRRAIEYEIKRQIEILDREEKPVQQTRGYSENKNVTVPQREKEEAHDYRYFPEPDIPPMRFPQDQILKIKDHIGELPEAKSGRFQEKYALSAIDSEQLTETKERADYFENCVALTKSAKEFSAITSKQIANVLINRHTDYGNTSPYDLLQSLVNQKQENDINIHILTKTIESVILTNGKAVEDYRKGKTSVLMFLVGQVKRTLNGKGDAEIIKQELLNFIKL